MPQPSITRRIRRALTSLLVRRVAREESARRAPLGAEFEGLPPALWGCDIDPAGRMTVQGVPLETLARDYGSPLHVVDRQRLVQNAEAFLAPFRAQYPRVSLASSYKTNPLPGVLEVLHSIGTYAEVISPFEFWLARRLGMPGERILYNGPGKTPESLREAVQAGVRLINVDGLHELPVISRAAQESGLRQRVGLRVVTSVGWSGQFGFSLADGSAWNAFREMQTQGALDPVGLHLHLGTGIKDLATYRTAVEQVFDFGRRLRAELGIAIDCYDLGGGFGVPTVRSRSTWDDRLVQHGYAAPLALPADCPAPSDYAAALLPVLERHRVPGETPPEIIFEPGRAVTSSAQILLLSVLSTKTTADGRTAAILDGGKNLTLPLEWETHQIFPVGRMREAAETACDLYGPLCHPGDVVARAKPLPRLQSGDVLAVMDAGAYFIPNQLNFSQPRPAVVMLEDGHVRSIRARERFEDIVRLDTLPGAPGGA